MAYYYFTGKHLHDIRLKTGPKSPCGRSSQSGVILSTARLGPHALREGGHPSLLFNHPEMWVGGGPTFKSTARLGAHPCVARVGKTTTKPPDTLVETSCFWDVGKQEPAPRRLLEHVLLHPPEVRRRRHAGIDRLQHHMVVISHIHPRDNIRPILLLGRVVVDISLDPARAPHEPRAFLVRPPHHVDAKSPPALGHAGDHGVGGIIAVRDRLELVNFEYQPGALLTAVEKRAGLGIAGSLHEKHVNRHRPLRNILEFHHEFSVRRRVLPRRPRRRREGGPAQGAAHRGHLPAIQ